MYKILAIFTFFRNYLAHKLKASKDWYELMQEKRMERSRDNWKVKAVDRATLLREARKAKAIDIEKIRLLREDIKLLASELEEVKKNPNYFTNGRTTKH